MSYYVVTGSNGMIGSQLLKYLKESGWNTKTFTKLNIDSCENQENMKLDLVIDNLV